MNIVCFLFHDWQFPLGTVYVNRLYRMLRRNTSLDFDFYCFTDSVDCVDFDSPIKIVRFDSKYRYNLNKLEAFNPKQGFMSQTFIFDLDVVIIDNMDEILSYKGDFCTLSGVYHNRIGMPAGTLVSFNPEKNHDIYHRLNDNYARVETITRGSERFFYDLHFKDKQIDYFQDLFPGSILSYKAEFIYRKLQSNTCMIWFHGKPKPHEVCEYQPLIGEHWQ